MKNLISLHRDLLNSIADKLGLSAYQIVWISFFKGLAIGCVVGVYL